VVIDWGNCLVQTLFVKVFCWRWFVTCYWERFPPSLSACPCGW